MFELELRLLSLPGSQLVVQSDKTVEQMMWRQQQQQHKYGVSGLPKQNVKTRWRQLLARLPQPDSIMCISGAVGMSALVLYSTS